MGTVETALVKYMLAQNPDICETTGSVNPLVCECNDSGLNDIRGLHVTEQNVFDALADCKADFAEGAVGAGRGMRCHGLKGGIGSASRVVELDGKKNYTIGSLVLSNHAMFDDLIVGGTPIQQLLKAHIPPHEDKGSIITVLATDIPLSERQLRRLCHRALVGLSRTGSYCGNGSGEIVLAFTTANRMPHYADKALLPMTMLHDDAINPLFRAVAECVEESVLSSLFHAETVTGYHGKTVPCLTDLLEGKIERKNDLTRQHPQGASSLRVLSFDRKSMISCNCSVFTLPMGVARKCRWSVSPGKLRREIKILLSLRRDRERGGCPMTLSEVLQLLAIIGGAVFVTFQITWTIANGNQNKKRNDRQCPQKADGHSFLFD